MKRKLTILSTMIFFFLSLAGMSHAQRLSLKLTGGYGMLTAGDYNTFGESIEALMDDGALYLGLTKEGEFQKLKMGFEYGGEIIVKLVGGVRIGVGAEYIQRSSETEMTLKNPLVETFTLFSKPDLSAIPVTLTLYYFLPSPPLVKIYLNGGLGYYFGITKHTLRIDTEVTGLPADWGKTVGEIKDQGVGFHGGLGLESG